MVWDWAHLPSCVRLSISCVCVYVHLLVQASTAGTHFMHESFNKDNFGTYTRYGTLLMPRCLVLAEGPLNSGVCVGRGAGRQAMVCLGEFAVCRGDL
jgi:hypothetical protein